MSRIPWRLVAEVEIFDDGPVKPVRICSRVGRRPLIAFGNANGDVEMLEYARYGALILHEDGDREFAYETGAEQALAAAPQLGMGRREHERRRADRLRASPAGQLTIA